MSGTVLQFSGGVTLLGGGTVDQADIAAALARAPALIAADGGAQVALSLGFMPEAVFGDMDSLGTQMQAHLADRIHRIDEQDSTDFGKCLNHVAAGFYLCLGFTGLRLDHTLAALSEVATRPGQIIVLIGEDEVVLFAKRELRLDLPEGTRLSLYPMGRAQGRSRGLRWPIDGIAFAPAGRVGTSNEVTGPVWLDITGPMLVLVPKAHLDAVLGALLP